MPALDGIRVLDFSQVIFGPAATQVLADHGADVIKVERPPAGDLARAFGPWRGDLSLPFASLNRGKRSLAVDLKQEEGQRLVARLLEGTDVLVHNFRSDAVMQRLGLGWEDLARRHPRLIYAAGFGYGSVGPYVERGKAGHESMAQALSGLADRFRGPGGRPQRLPYTLSDLTAGGQLAQAILLALFARERTGRGQRVETSLLDGVMALQAWESAAILNVGNDVDHGAGGATDPRGNPLDGAVFATADGHLMVTALFRPVPQLMQALATALDLPALGDDERFADIDGLRRHRDDLRGLLEPVFLGRANAAWIDRLEAQDLLVAPVRSTAEALADPQLRANDLLVDAGEAEGQPLRLVGPPLRLSDTPARGDRPAPGVGEHTDEVLTDAGLSADEIGRLRATGTVCG
jgi:crotonobetainyl-CoA:carnitine CoA-transferase CaiB-like acyl-CoA transferase